MLAATAVSQSTMTQNRDKRKRQDGGGAAPGSKKSKYFQSVSSA